MASSSDPSRLPSKNGVHSHSNVELCLPPCSMGLVVLMQLFSWKVKLPCCRYQYESHEANYCFAVLFVISSATKFRSKAGYCICGMKSQKGKPFLTSNKYKTKFSVVFGIDEIDGDLCSLLLCSGMEGR